MNRRGLRSGSASIPRETSDSSPLSSPVSFVSGPKEPSKPTVQIIRPGTKLLGLSKEELKLLREKQERLRSTSPATLENLPPGAPIRNALESTLIFAQYEAGTAVCIDASGWILTCAHCFGDDEAEYRSTDKRRWLLYYTGLAVQVECRFWDPKRDLALLKVVAIESDEAKPGDAPAFRYVKLCESMPSYKMSILCIGQPGRDDLESTSERRTKYNLVEVSEGCFKGMMKGADPQDNSEIGSLMHDAWTYWGHSGAPLIRAVDGTLVGLHSSWDDRTAMRHGVPGEAIGAYLKESRMGEKARVAGSQENPLDVS